MSVERMKLLSVVGKEEHMNAFICRYLLETGLQPENAIKVFEKGWNLSYFQYDNTPKEIWDKCQALQQDLHIENKGTMSESITIQDSLITIQNEIHSLQEKVTNLQTQITQKQTIKESIGENAENVRPLQDLNLNLKDLFELRYMRFRYGKIPLVYEPKLIAEKPVLDAVAFEVCRDDSYLWLVYVTTQNYSKKVDSFFNLIKFDRIWLPKEIEGKPKEFLTQVDAFFIQTEEEIKALKQALVSLQTQYEDKLLHYSEELNLYIKISHVKRYMAHDDKGNFYIVRMDPNRSFNGYFARVKKRRY